MGLGWAILTYKQPGLNDSPYAISPYRPLHQKISVPPCFSVRKERRGFSLRLIWIGGSRRYLYVEELLAETNMGRRFSQILMCGGVLAEIN